MTNKQDAIELWQKLGIEYAEFEFDCGGDSMNETNIVYYKKGEMVNEELLDTYFDNEIYNEVTFYEASDGYYIGERGSVHIELNENKDDFEYEKSAEQEYSERFTEKTKFNLTENEINLIKKYVANINGGWGDTNINYKEDCIINDADDMGLKAIANRMYDFAEEYCFESAEGEADDNTNFTTNDAENDDRLGEDIEFVDGGIIIQVSRNYTIYRND